MKMAHLTWGQAAGIGLLVYFCCTGLLIGLSLVFNDGAFVYYIDDTYIHLATARQLAEKGVWGVAKGDFVFCSSSPHYAALLGALFLVINWSYWPLALNLLAGSISIGLFLQLFKKCGHRPKPTLPWLITWLLLVPLPFLAFTGMEHTLHLAACLWLAILVLFPQPGSRQLILLAISACLAAGFRYEGMYVVMAAAGLLGWFGRYRAVLAVLAGGAMPVFGYGLYSLNQGGGFFPTSILLKGYHPGPDTVSWLGMVLHFAETLHKQGFISVLLVLLAFVTIMGLLQWPTREAPPAEWRLSLFTLLVLLMHLPTSKVGGVRYEAYLIALGLPALMLATSSALKAKNIFKLTLPYRLLVAGCAGLMLLPFLLRAGFFSWNAPRGSNNIYSQQYQMARFLNMNYPDASVAANDIGAITYFTDIRLTDLVGLGDQELLPYALAHTLDTLLVDRIARQRNIELAVVYDSWVGEVIPASWTPVAHWSIDNNFICGDSVVTWYAVQPWLADTLRQQLEAFNPTLPRHVKARLLPTD